MAIMFVRAQVISRGSGRNVVSAAAYRHRARMRDEQAGRSFSRREGASELVHEELALPDQVPAWLKTQIDGQPVARASEALWNAVEMFEKRADAELARELIIALPEELTRAENIALIREFVRDNFTSKGMVADWVYHDKDGNPHIHLMTALRPLTEEGFGRKRIPVLGEGGEPLRVVTPDSPSGKIVYKRWAGDRETLKAWKIAWAETANRHLALAKSARVLSERKGFGVTGSHVSEAVRSVETADPEKPSRLDQEQVDAVRHVTSDSGIAAVVGLAGAGKSTLLAAARVAWESDRRRVIGAALTGKAAEGLEDSSGIRSRTLASWELAWAGGRDLLDRGDVLVIDEAGMVSSQQMARILKGVEDAGAKVVLVGDAMQLQPIQAGAAFRAISERVGFAELAGVRRQSEQWARDASRLFARGEIEKGLDAYAQRGRIVETDTRDEVIGRIVSDWADARKQAIGKSVSDGKEGGLRGDELLVLAHTNDAVRKLNEALRKVMTDEGSLADAREFQTERGLREFAAGDRIIFLENARFLEPRARHFGPQYVKNGMLGTVISTGEKRGDTLLQVRLDNGRDVVFSEDSYRNVDHGYAATIHKSQGATVDRTFVLATGMMDQHLTYVAMTRHRDRADLYAAREDFEAKPDWGRTARVDYIAGITGELIKEGLAKFRDADDVEESPYVDVSSDDGATHRLWGVSLPKALEEGGVAIGDTVTLRKDGVDKVAVKVPVVDEETGDKRYEEREVDRNVWTAKQIEAADARRERIERESHRPEVFRQLVERLSRFGAKTTTLDFESESGYQAHASDFARRRGLDHLSLAVAGMEECVSRRLAWVEAKREQVAKLWERASVALGFAIERERRVSYSEERTGSLSEGLPIVGHYLIPPTTEFARSAEEDARLAQLSSPSWKEREQFLRPLLEKVYRDPDAALSALNSLASDAGIEPRELAGEIAITPSRLGRLRGSDLMVEGRAARDERGAAMAALKELLPLARDHATEFRRNVDRFREREKTRRAYMSLSIPAISKHALARLMEIEAVRNQGGDDAYKTAFAFAVEDRSIVQEIKAVSDALTGRFGWSAFTAKADAIAERNVAERMPEDLTDIRRGKLARLFEAVRRFTEEQHLAETKDRSKIVAGASVDFGKEAKTVLPMLAAVTEFKTPLDEEARTRALTAAHYRHHRAALAETAVRIWRDPAAAVEKIEDLIVKGFAAERIAAAVIDEPTAYGGLRGSDRLMDRMLASGRERKDALQAVPETAGHLRSLGAAYVSAFDTERQAITEERRRMAVAIPVLSQAAEDALRQLASEMNKKDSKLDVAAGSLNPAIRHELAAVSRALDERFGRNAILRGGKDLINRVPPAQRRAFEAMQEKLKVLQQTVRMQSSEQILSERRQRTINYARGVDR
ncbi:MobA/MobL family protein [Ensifer sp. IC3342]|nr:MobA/MobL family protein [Ensifer sp. BRP08]MCA1451199.1 MobA/MobL family protein [Ensifer sp. IC3342]